MEEEKAVNSQEVSPLAWLFGEISRESSSTDIDLTLETFDGEKGTWHPKRWMTKPANEGKTRWAPDQGSNHVTLAWNVPSGSRGHDDGSEHVATSCYTTFVKELSCLVGPTRNTMSKKPCEVACLVGPNTLMTNNIEDSCLVWPTRTNIMRKPFKMACLVGPSTLRMNNEEEDCLVSPTNTATMWKYVKIAGSASPSNETMENDDKSCLVSPARAMTMWKYFEIACSENPNNVTMENDESAGLVSPTKTAMTRNSYKSACLMGSHALRMNDDEDSSWASLTRDENNAQCEMNETKSTNDPTEATLESSDSSTDQLTTGIAELSLRNKVPEDEPAQQTPQAQVVKEAGREPNVGNQVVCPLVDNMGRAATMTSAEETSRSLQRRRPQRNRTKCYKCGTRGHLAADCNNLDRGAGSLGGGPPLSRRDAN